VWLFVWKLRIRIKGWDDEDPPPPTTTTNKKSFEQRAPKEVLAATMKISPTNDWMPCWSCFTSCQMAENRRAKKTFMTVRRPMAKALR
jgi:hypothetical protein